MTFHCVFVNRIAKHCSTLSFLHEYSLRVSKYTCRCFFFFFHHSKMFLKRTPYLLFSSLSLVHSDSFLLKHPRTATCAETFVFIQIKTIEINVTNLFELYSNSNTFMKYIIPSTLFALAKDNHRMFRSLKYTSSYLSCSSSFDKLNTFRTAKTSFYWRVSIQIRDKRYVKQIKWRLY